MIHLPMIQMTIALLPLKEVSQKCLESATYINVLFVVWKLGFAFDILYMCLAVQRHILAFRSAF